MTRQAGFWGVSLVLWLSLALRVGAQPVGRPVPETEAQAWADATLLSLSIEEKIGQLFMVYAASRPNLYNPAEIETAVSKFKVGGLIWFQGGPVRQAELSNRYQQMATVPLLMAQDAEWSLAMRLDSTLSYPRAMALGAIDDDSLLVAFGRQLARECRAVGVQVPFGPVVDVNNNALNPVIAQRSFGSDKHRVTRCALRVMLGMQSGGVMAVAKHFPGHGDTDVDSHLALPVLRQSRERLDSLELYPFRSLIDQGVAGMMVAHLTVPSLDSSESRRGGIPTTLSPRVVTDLLRSDLHFSGLVFTDALTMNGVMRHYAPGEIELQAYLAGADMLLLPENLPVAFDRMRKAAYSGEISLAELDARVRRILLAKARLGLHRQRLVNPAAVRGVLDAPEAIQLHRELARRSVVLASDPERRLPIGGGDSSRIAVIQFGGATAEPFVEQLRLLSGSSVAKLPKDATSAQVQGLLDSLGASWPKPSLVVLGLYQTSRLGQPRFGITPTIDDVICGLQRMKLPLACVTFGVPYAIQHLPEQAAHIIVWSDDPEGQNAAAGMVLGTRVPNATLPVAVPGRTLMPPVWRTTQPRIEMAEVPLAPKSVFALDRLADSLVAAGAMPGTVVMAVRGTELVLAKGYGKTELGGTDADPASTLYDLASVTKVLATTLVAMRLIDDNRLDLTAPLSRYLPELAGTELGKRTPANLLAHDSGLPPFNHSMRIKRRGEFDPTWVRAAMSDSFAVPFAEGLFVRKDLRDTVLSQLLRSVPTAPAEERVVYSDLGMIILATALERILGERLEFFLQREFYQPLGMLRTGFNPALKCLSPSVQIAPTEIDTVLGRGVVRGFVHDETAALLGGAAGHAGLFSTGADIAKLILMLKSGGVYAGRRYLSEQTIRSFTHATSSTNRRGLGWDKPPKDPTLPSPTSSWVSSAAYGHLGFTGTCVWVDPAADLAIVILANRTYPTRNNGIYNAVSFRTRAVGLIYEAIGLAKPQKASR